MSLWKRGSISADLLDALHYASAEEAAREMLCLSARSRYAEFRQEVQRFEQKYQMPFEAFQQVVEGRVHEEDFGQEEDLLAWKFAAEAVAYWQGKLEELERAAGSRETLRRPGGGD